MTGLAKRGRWASEREVTVFLAGVEQRQRAYEELNCLCARGRTADPGLFIPSTAGAKDLDERGLPPGSVLCSSPQAGANRLRGSAATHGCDGMGLIDGMLLSGIRVLLIHTAPIRELSLDVLCGMASD